MEMCPHKKLDTDVYGTIILNSQKVETIQMSTYSRWNYWWTVIFLHNGIPQRQWVIYNHMNNPVTSISQCDVTTLSKSIYTDDHFIWRSQGDKTNI